MEEERASLTVPEDISDAEIQGMVDRLFELEDRNWLNYKRLELVGRKAHPFFVRTLDDPRIAERFKSEEVFHHGPKVPLQRVIGLLEPLDEPLVVLTLKKYVRHPNEEVRRFAAHMLGEIGTPACIEPVVTLLDDEDDYVRSSAMRGIRSSINGDRASREFLDSVFAALVKLLDRRDLSISGNAPGLMLTIDRERALPILLSPEYFTVKNRELHYIFNALNHAAHKIPRNQLLPLLNELKSMGGEYPHDYAYAAALTAYAQNPDGTTEQVLRAEVSSPHERVQKSAAEALGILSGIGLPSLTVFEAERERGFDSLTEPQRHYYATWMYDAEVNNGGHSQYFVNSTGDQWPIALAGLKAICATERASILQEATGLFGAQGPSQQNEKRHRQLSKFSEWQDSELDKLNSRYHASKENVEALLSLYAIDNAEAFRR